MRLLKIVLFHFLLHEANMILLECILTEYNAVFQATGNW